MIDAGAVSAMNRCMFLVIGAGGYSGLVNQTVAIEFNTVTAGTNTTIPLNQWVHLAATVEATMGATRIYINGRPAAMNFRGTQSNVVNTTFFNSVGIFGKVATAAYGEALYDDCRIYNRILTLGEIRLLASRRGIGLTSTRKRPPCSYPITTPPDRLYGKSSGLWIPGVAEVNKNDFWASYSPQTTYYHAEAVAWEAAVRANSGTVSPETLQAVSNFCTAIDTAGIRGKLYRVNLFCGDNLRACLVPLYTSPVAGNAPVGGYAVDFNTGFLNSDYMEKGIGTGGLRGNGIAVKKLSTNLTPQDIVTNAATGHFGMYIPPWRLPVANHPTVDTPVASVVGGTRIYFDWRHQPGSSAIGLKINWGASITGSGIANPFGLMMGDRSSTTRVDMYRQGVSVANGTTPNGAMPPMVPYEIFSNQLSVYTANPLFGYTLGRSLTAAEHVAYSAAWNTFQAALRRNV
jgi:hypothetical protein